jgi:hypothetical protein
MKILKNDDDEKKSKINILKGKEIKNYQKFVSKTIE